MVARLSLVVFVICLCHGWTGHVIAILSFGYHRNPEYSLRPPFDRVCEYLDSQDEMLLHWVSSDSIPGKHTHLLGAPLEESTDLYFDLQRTYQQSMLDETNGKKRSQSTRT